MKKLFYLPLIAAMALTGCSSDEPAMGDGNNDADEGGRFLAVSIVPNDNGAGRAGYEDSDGLKFEDGTGEESTINGIRLYFFSSSGDAVTVKGNKSYYDITKDVIDEELAGADHSVTLEQRINAIIVVNPGEKLPAQIVAVVNPDEAELGTTNYTLTGLTEKVGDFATPAITKKSFLMSNSTYVDGSDIVKATQVSASSYCETVADAKEHAVEIYVERAVAKVRLSATKLTKVGDLYQLYSKVDNEDKELTVGSGDAAKNVYLKLEGWDVTATLPLSYLLKDVVASWVDTKLGPNTHWNDVKYHRSYWANVCNGGAGKTNTNQYFAYNDNTRFRGTLFDGQECTYCNENGEHSGSLGIQNTKVIIKGTICDEAGKPLTITEFGGNRIIDNTKFTGLKNRYFLMLKSSRGPLPWKEVTEDGVTKYEQFSAADIDFVAAESVNKVKSDNTGRYYVYACLSADAKSAKWYKSIDMVNGVQTPVDEVTTASIEESLLSLSHAKIWNTGMTYYYTDIKHIGISYGVIRNHIYDIALTKIYGLGTPVYDETKVIIPEKPQNDETYMAAKVNILSWRVVPSDVELDWND